MASAAIFETASYEDLCIEHHRAAEQIQKKSRCKKAGQPARKAHISAWKLIPNAAFCALIADDVATIMTLLFSGQNLSPFTAARMRWYQQGRAPWGYIGDFPAGQWLIL